jgi:EAL domain-containing protein (putative c-di-GMP-specific phosphodiesterase class I)
MVANDDRPNPLTPPMVLVEEAVGAAANEIVAGLLRAVRRHLDLDVAFIGAIDEVERRIEYVDSAPESTGILSPGMATPLEESYCGHILAGRLPRWLVDPRQHPVSAAMDATYSVPVGTHVGVPIELPDGRTYGTLCCFSHDIEPSLDRTALGALYLVADLAAEYLHAIEQTQQERHRRCDLTRRLLDDPSSIEMVYQPLLALDTMEVVGVEALSRFPGFEQSPAWFFSEAAACGLGVEMEMVAVRAALADLDRIPPSVRLSVNVSPETLYADEFYRTIAGVPPDRLVVEVTEHAVVDDYTKMRAASRWLTDHGVRLAIDDVGMGFSGLNRILESSPEELKLDAAVIRDVDTNPLKQSMVEMFCAFGQRAGFAVVAEGIETEAEYEALRRLGAPVGQGYYLWRPAPLEDIVRHI